MAKRSRITRPEIRVTAEWYQTYCASRLQERDLRILRFIFDNRIVTSDQVARLEFTGPKAQALCNRRLRVLYDLHCIDRLWPPVAKGSAMQHLVLDSAGARALNLEDWKKISELPLTYRHTVMVAEYRLLAYKQGWSWGKTEHSLGPVTADIWYPGSSIAVEIDMGTEGLDTLKKKALKYQQVRGLGWVVFLTVGAADRVKIFLASVHVARHKAGAQFKDIGQLLTGIQSA